jgi:integrase
MAKFIIRTQKTVGNASLYFLKHIRQPKDKLLWLNTHINVDIVAWNKADTETKKANFIKSNHIDGKLKEISDTVDTLVKDGTTDTKKLDDAIKSIAFREVRQDEAMREIAREAKAKAARDKEREDVIAYLYGLIERMAKGEKRTDDGEPFEYGTVKSWRAFASILSSFMYKHPFSWADVNKQLIDKFRAYDVQNGYMKTTANLHLRKLRALCRYAFDEEVCTNTAILNPKLFRIATEREQDKAAEIYLSMDEVHALYEMPLVGALAKVRDVFLVGCLTGQRFSDYSRINAKCIDTTAKGTPVIRITQEKTNTNVVIPINAIDGDMLTAILEKYKYDLPEVAEQVLNRYIKRILKQLSESVPTLQKMVPTVLTIKERTIEKNGKGKKGNKESVVYERDNEGNPIKPRYELVTSHTARRTAITNLYLMGRYTNEQMRAISGHKTQKVFEEYVKLSGDELADIIDEANVNKGTGTNNDLF